MDYIAHLAIDVFMLAILAISLNLVLGYLGILSLCHGCFFGIGAYTSTILLMKFGVPWTLAAIGGGVLSGVCAAIFFKTASRLRGDNLAIASLAFQIVVVDAMRNLRFLTGGAMGIPGIPRPSFLGTTVGHGFPYIVLMFLALLLVVVVTRRICLSPFGKICLGIRDMPEVMASLGRNESSIKFRMFFLSGFLAGVAGSFFASYYTFIDPRSFELSQSLLILSAVIIGGAGTVRGPIVGAAFVVFVPEIVRSLGIAGHGFANIREILFSLLVVLFIIFRSQGLAGRFNVSEVGGR